MSDDVVVLSPDADPYPEHGEHPDKITREDAEAGYVTYLEVDDLDDESNGIYVEGATS
jgi:hypothetical protein